MRSAHFSVENMGASEQVLESSGLFYLRWWVGIVGAIALFNALYCYVDQMYTSKRIYTLQPKHGVVCRL